MRAAQTLYEGVDIAGHGTVGLITYMRTDSLRISDEAVAAAKEFIAERYGADTMSAPPAHLEDQERDGRAGRPRGDPPLDAGADPRRGGQEHQRRYRQAVPADLEPLYGQPDGRLPCRIPCIVTDDGGGLPLPASGYTVTFDGFTALYEEATDEKEKKETALPPLEEGQLLKLRSLKQEQKFTQPPARYTEATLIKALEENGIGRPSTYAPIITTIIDRGYVERDQKKLKPTPLGRAVNGLMLEQFPNIVDVNFSRRYGEEAG